MPSSSTYKTAYISKFIALLIILAIYSTFKLKGQQSNTLFLMHDVPQTNLINPAVQIPCKWYVGIPALTSIHADYSNTGFSVNNIVELSLNDLAKKAHKTDLISTELRLNLISLGYRKNDYYITFNIAEKVNIAATYPGDVVGLAVHGNSEYIGETIKLNNFRVHGVHYREYALGLSKVVDHQLVVGAKAKLLFGKSNIYSGKSELSLGTDGTTFDLSLDGDISINSSYPLTIDQDADGTISGMSAQTPDILNYLMNSSNKGFAIDLGAIYRYDEKITLSASLIDLGFIKWKSDVNNIALNGSFTYSGPDLGDDFTGDDFIFELRDSIYDAFNFDVNQNSYYSWLPTQIYLGGTYSYGPKLDIGLTNRNQIYRNKLHSSITLAANYDLTKNLLTVLSWSYLNNTLKNVGVGLAWHGKGIQFHLVSDNVLGFIWPLDARNANIRLGFNLMLGCPKNKKEELKNKNTFSGSTAGNCYWIKKAESKKKIKEKYSGKKKKKKR